MTSPIHQSSQTYQAPQTPPHRLSSSIDHPPPLNRINRYHIESLASSNLLHSIESAQRPAMHPIGRLTDRMDFRVISNQRGVVTRAISLHLRNRNDVFPLIPSPTNINSSGINLSDAFEQAHFHHATTTRYFPAYEGNLNDLLEEVCPISGLTIEDMIHANQDYHQHDIVTVTNGSGTTTIYDYRSLLEWGKQGSQDHRNNGLISDPLTRTHLIDVSESGLNEQQVAQIQPNGDIIRPQAIDTANVALENMAPPA